MKTFHLNLLVLATCDAFAGGAKTGCLDRARMNFGKP